MYTCRLHASVPTYAKPVRCALSVCSPHSSYDVARRTVLLLREVCSKTRWANARYMYTRVAAGFSWFSKNIPKPFLMYLHVAVLYVHTCILALIQHLICIMYRDQVWAVAKDLLCNNSLYIHVCMLHSNALWYTCTINLWCKSYATKFYSMV